MTSENQHKIYLESLKITSDCLNDPIIILDIFGDIKYTSKSLYKWLGVTNLELVDKNIFEPDLPRFIALYHKCQSEIKIQHAELTKLKERKVFLESSRYEDSATALFVTKTPILDNENNFLFLHIRFKQFTVARVANLAYKFYGVKGFPTRAKDFEKYELTRMQSLVLYMYARNYSYTEVADLLTRFGFKISPSAVNKQLNNLKKIFGVSGHEQLKDMSLKLGYDVAIPAEFIPEGSHDITGDIFELWVC